MFGDNGYFRDRSMDYKGASSVAEIKLSDDKQTAKIQKLYPIPEVKKTGVYKPAAFKDVPRPDSVLSFFKDGSIQVRRDGNEDWIWVNQPKERLVYLVEAFWRENRIALDKVDAQEGFIETVWVHQIEGEAGANLWEKSVSGWKKITKFRQPLQKFRVKVITAKEERQSKVLLSHTSADVKKGKDYPATADDLVWIASSEKDEFHHLILQQLVDYLGSEKNQRPSSSLAQGIEPAPTRVVMTKDGNGYPVLVVEQDFNRAWETIGKSLRKGKVPVEDLNRSLAIYYVGYPGKENEKELLIYEVKLSQGENGILIAVQQNDETLAPIEVSEVILAIIKSNVS